MASKYKTKVEKYSRPEGAYVEYPDKSVTFEDTRDKAFVKTAISVLELMMRGYKVCAYEDTDRDAIRVDADEILNSLFNK